MQKLHLDGTGLASYDDEAGARTAQVAADDLARMLSVLDTSSTENALGDQSPCIPQTTDMEEWMRLQFEAEALLAKETFGCDEDPYQRIRTEAARLRDQYFGPPGP